MGKVIVDISMSLDGYIAGAGVDLANGLGVGGEALHYWAIDHRTARDEEILAETMERTGAVIMGRETFNIVDGPHGWGDETGYGAQPDGPAAPPVFVITHSEPDTVRLGSRFVFVTDGPASAVGKARAVAGDKDVVIMGGGQVCHEFLAAGLVDVLSIHLAPIVLGAGRPLFPVADSAPVRLELTGSESTPSAEHLVYRVLTPA